MTDRRMDGRCIRAHRAICTGGLNQSLTTDHDTLASCPWGPATTHRVGILAAAGEVVTHGQTCVDQLVV